eukprot:CCRYP_008669-RA/>CCRYP_008669-RA protein AED:0.06 eAED:0.06 QI:12/0/0.5/1/1/1/2/0/783
MYDSLYVQLRIGQTLATSIVLRYFLCKARLKRGGQINDGRNVCAMSDDDECNRSIEKDFPLTVSALKALDAVPPPPFSCQEGASKITRANFSEHYHARDRHVGSNNDHGTEQIFDDVNLMESPIPKNNNNVSITASTCCTPHKTPTSINKYIQNAQIELDQIHQQTSFRGSVSSHSPKTPHKEVVSPELADYIRSAEKEMEKLLKETLDSPVTTVPMRSSSSLEDAEEVLRDQSSPLDEVTRNLTELDHQMDVTNVDCNANSNNEDDSIMCSAERRQYVNDSKEVGRQSPGRKRYSLRKAILSAFFVVMLIIRLGSMYPVSPLLSPQIGSMSSESCPSSENLLNQCFMSAPEPPYLSIERFKLGLATFSFVVATSIRTIVLAPLQRIYDNIQSRQQKIRLLSQFLNWCNHFADKMEEYSYIIWEDAARYHGVLDDRELSRKPRPLRHPPELDMDMLIPCNRNEARVHILQNDKPIVHPTNDLCPLRDVIDRDLLMAYAMIHFDAGFSLATHPLVLRNLWPGEAFDNSTSNQRRLTPLGILKDPQLSTFILPNYFADATKTGYSALVPDANRISLSQFVTNIVTGASPYAKIGTQNIVEDYPELRDEIAPSRLAKDLFGWNPWFDDFKHRIAQYLGPTFNWFVQMLPSSTYYPIFIAGIAVSSDAHSRTDLHTEPIGNIAVQMHGHRHWTLIPTQWSGLLRPQFQSMEEHNAVALHAPSCSPPWMWHRIDYKPATAQDKNENDRLSIGASIFHFYPKLYAMNFPLFACIIWPNLIWEVFGFNIE